MHLTKAKLQVKVNVMLDGIVLHQKKKEEEKRKEQVKYVLKAVKAAGSSEV